MTRAWLAAGLLAASLGAFAQGPMASGTSAPAASASAAAVPVAPDAMPSAPVPAAAPAERTSATPMPTPEQAAEMVRSDRFRHLAAELRCLVCQNQTLADSGADLAIDLRNEVLKQMAAGRDDREIKDHLVERYGEFVLYRPEFSVRNLALWVGPAVLMAIGAIVVWRLARRRGTEATGPVPLDEARMRRVERLLGDDPPRG
jgi:cytochrome c-type biogenesis protein CcmH